MQATKQSNWIAAADLAHLAINDRFEDTHY